MVVVIYRLQRTKFRVHILYCTLCALKLSSCSHCTSPIGKLCLDRTADSQYHPLFSNHF